ncbi:imelysin family protein [Profundibacter sp.]
MRIILTACFTLLGLPALADINAVIDDHILKRHADFTQSTAALVDAAKTDCTPAGVTPAYHAAFDTWVAVSHIRFGPIEDSGEGLAVAFWPDKKGKIPKTLKRMIKEQDPVVNDAAGFAKYSVAARGFFALEQMLFDETFSDYGKDSYSCALTQAITSDLARIAQQTHDGWVNGYAETLRSAGAAGNEVFLTDKEGAQALFTNMLAGLEYIHSQRLGRPIGSFEKARPKRAEARRSNRSMRNIVVSLESLQEMVQMLADGQALETMEWFASTISYAKTLDDSAFVTADENSGRFKLTSLQEMIGAIHEAAMAEVGAHLGVVAGFNALDGD